MRLPTQSEVDNFIDKLFSLPELDAIAYFNGLERKEEETDIELIKRIASNYAPDRLLAGKYAGIVSEIMKMLLAARTAQTLAIKRSDKDGELTLEVY